MRAVVLRAGAVAILGAACVGAFAAAASAQKVDPRRPRNFVVGEAKGPSVMSRADAHRSGFVRAGLPTGPLKVGWRKSLGSPGETTPLVTSAGEVVLVSGRGEVFVVGAEGEEQTLLATGVATTGSPALLSDGTVILTGGAGDVVGVRAGAIRFRTRVASDRSGVARIAPLPTSDGGVIVGGGSELVLLDADGGTRARATFPELVSGPLAAAAGKVVVTSALGAVYAWVPGREPVRVGSFGSPTDGGGVVSPDEKSLLAIVEGNRLVELDLAKGVAVTRVSAPPGGALLGPPALRGSAAHMMAMVPGRAFVLAVDAAGQETLRAAVATLSAPAVSDAGAPALMIPPHAGVLVDGAGATAFVTPDGRPGVVSASGGVHTVPEPVCGRPSSLAPTLAAAPGGFFVACPNGNVAKVVPDRGK